MLSRATEAPSTSDTLLQFSHDDNFRGIDPLNHQLGDPVPFLDLKIHLGMIEQEDLDRSSVIRIDDPRPRVDEMLDREARSGRDSSV